MDFEYVVFIQFKDATFGDYCLPARVIKRYPTKDDHVWVQYLLPDSGPINVDDLEGIVESEVSGMPCKLLPLCDQYSNSVLEQRHCTVSYTVNSCKFTTFLCDGLWCDTVQYVKLMDFAAKFTSQFNRQIMMDVTIFLDEVGYLCKWTGDKRALAYLPKVLH